MKSLARALLCGAALCALASASAIAGSASRAPVFHVTALHGGRVVNKTKLPNHGATHLTYTFAVYDYLPGSTSKKQLLGGSRLCPAPTKVKVAPKKTEYAKIGVHAQTYSNGCAYVAATYKVLNPPTSGVDNFVMSVISKYEQDGTKYKATLNLDCTVFLE
jgi:hypothetical protein